MQQTLFTRVDLLDILASWQLASCGVRPGIPGLCPLTNPVVAARKRSDARRMDPTEEELAAINTVDDALDWAGVAGVLRQSLLDAMGGVQRVREVPLIHRQAWDTTVEALVMPEDADPALVGPPNQRPLTPVEGARIESFRRVCHMRIGRLPDDRGGGVLPVPPQPIGAPFPPAGGAVQQAPATTRRVKLSSIVDPTLDADITPMSNTEQAEAYRQYRERFGDYPSPDCDPSGDQLSGLSQILAAGAAPFCCFTVWGPHGQRLLRKQTFTSYQLNVATGEWSKKELPGPSNYHSWYQSWRVFRSAMLLLQACDAERLDCYAETIRGFVTQFGDDAWFLISKADSQMRSEHLERIRRQLRATPSLGFTENSPWSSCFAMACKDHEYWSKELHTPATVLGPTQEGAHEGGATQWVTAQEAEDHEGSPPWGGRASGANPADTRKRAPPGNEEGTEGAPKHRKLTPAEPDRPPTEHQRRVIAEARKGTQKKDQARAVETPAASTTEETKSEAADIIKDPSPPRTYGYWMHSSGDPRHKPWALVLFSGKSPEGDLQRALCALGWRVCAVDTVAPRPTDLLCDATWESIRTDLVDGKFKGLWIATPCETFSPLRERPPGPRVLRTVEQIMGLPRDTLTAAEQKQLKESNILIQRTASAAGAQTTAGNPWGIENPDHGEEKPSLWMVPAIAKLVEEKADSDVRFDQCRTGLATTKPTRLVSKGLNLEMLQGLRCNHPKQKQTRADGSTYWASHSSTVQQWVTNEEGQRERASKSQGQYTTELSSILASAFHATQRGADWLREDLAATELP
eukprot:s2001_g5.t1